MKRVGKRPLEMLARAGAFDVLDGNRARVFEALDALVAYSAAIHEAQNRPIRSVCLARRGRIFPSRACRIRDDWLPVERLTQEHLAIGFYLSGHPLDDYMSALKRRDVKTLTEVTLQAERGTCDCQDCRLGRQQAGTQIGQGQPLCLCVSCPIRPGFTR